MKKIKEEAYLKAKEVLQSCAHDTGFYASGLKGGYEATWSRDSMISSFGASLIGEDFKIPFKKSLELLAKWQTDKGQIPNCVGSYNLDRRSDKTYNSIDSSETIVDDFGTKQKIIRNIDTFSLNPTNGKFEYKKIKSITKARAPRHLLKIKLRSGRDFISSPYHRVIVWSNVLLNCHLAVQD